MRKHKVSRSLSLPRTMGGADRFLAILNGTMTALLCYSSMSPWFFAVGFASHIFLRWVTQKDPWWRQILIVYNRYGDSYEPDASLPSSQRYKRPYGFDSDLSC
ncbi:type IV secretion system protein TrbD (plasmid) [Pararobbsia alpina]|uniref:VirB3 family type IV secretion system protein n=1 Tax=Pararobbsia alpina TaxID=621374 RepID=UPI0039A47816